MNDNERTLLRFVCNGDIKKSQQQARIILNSITSQKDERLRGQLLHLLDTKECRMFEIPTHLNGLLVAEDMKDFPENRFVLRSEEAGIVNKVLASLKASGRLAELGISYLPSLMLYGMSGTGKTMLARYIAHRAERPFIYVRFSNVVSSYLGSTQSNIAKIFDYARTAPCVLCFDEIDAVGMARGREDDVGEMNRVVIALMQEMDRLPNDVVVIGTTNRFDRLDPALSRRFTVKHEIMPMNRLDILTLVDKFFNYTGFSFPDEFILYDWYKQNLSDNETASTIIEKCIARVVDLIMNDIERDDENEGCRKLKQKDGDGKWN